jgi:hypothetical protein
MMQIMFVFRSKQNRCQPKDIIQEDGGFRGLYGNSEVLIDSFGEQQKSQLWIHFCSYQILVNF